MANWLTDEYVLVDSFECSQIVAGAGGSQCVVLGTIHNEVNVVESNNRLTFDLDSKINDVASDNMLYVLTADSLFKYSTEGDLIWSVPVSGSRELAVLGKQDIVVVNTGSDELIGFQTDTGTEVFRVTKPKSDIGFDSTLVGHEENILVATWSFVSVLDSFGNIQDEYRFDGTIKFLSYINDTAIISFSDDRVVGVDITTGEQLWRRELSMKSQPGRHEESLVVLTDDGIRSLSSDGTVEQVSSTSAEQLFIASDGEPLCLLNNHTVSTYRKPGLASSALSVDIVSQTLPSEDGGPFRISITNEAEWPVETMLELVGRGMTVEPADVSVSIKPGESIQLEPTVSITADEGKPTITISCNDTELLAEALEYRPTSVLEVQATVDEIRDGFALLRINVKNMGQGKLSDISITPSGRTIEVLNSGEETQIETKLPFQANETFTAAASDDSGEIFAESNVELPSSPISISTETTDTGSFEIHLSNTTELPIFDRLIIEGTPLKQTVEHAAEIGANDNYVETVRSASLSGKEGTIVVTIPGVDVIHRVNADTLDLPAQMTTDEAQHTSPSKEATTNTTLSNGSQDESSTHATPSSDPQKKASVETGSPSVQPSSIDAWSEVSDTEPAVSQLVRETVHLKNTGDRPVKGIIYKSGDVIASIDRLSQNEETALSRSHSFANSASLDSGTVLVGNETIERVDSHDISVTTGDVVIDGVVTSREDSEYSVTLSVRNTRNVPCSLERAVFQSGDVWEFGIDERVEPNETFERSDRIQWSESLSETTAEVRLEFSFEDREHLTQFTTLLPVEQPDRNPLNELIAKLSYQTRVSQGQGTVILTLVNTTDSPISDVTAEAIGDDVDASVYTGERFESISSGDRREHSIQIATEQHAVDFVVKLRAIIDGDETEEMISVRGPVDRDHGWHKSLLDEWEIDRSVGGAVKQSTHLATTFRTLETDEEQSRLPTLDDESSPSMKSDVQESGATGLGQSRPATPSNPTDNRFPDDEMSTTSPDTHSGSPGPETRPNRGQTPLCTECGESLPEGANYCPYCETKLSSGKAPVNPGGGSTEIDTSPADQPSSSEDCGFCGKPVPGGANYCPYCEAKLGDARQSKETEPESDTRYCEYCGSAVDPHAQTCPSCNVELPS